MSAYLVTSDIGDIELKQVKLLLQKMPVMAQCMNGEGDLEYVSDLWLETMGYEREDVLGKKNRDFLADSDLVRFEEAFEKLNQEGFCKNLDYRLKTKSGRLVDVCFSATAIKDESGQVVRIFATLANNTTSNETRRKNRQLSERLNLALDASKIGIWEWKVDEDKLIWEDQMYEVYGCSKEDFSHDYEDWKKRIHPDDQEKVNDEVQKALAGKASLDTEFRVTDSTGKIRYIRSRAIVTNDSKGRPIRMVGANWDVSKEKELLEELKAEQIKMLHAARLASVGEMAAGIAHEINNPLMVIKTKVEFFKQLLESNNSDRSQHLEIASKVDAMVNRIAAIVTGLKNFSRQGFSTKLKEESLGKIIDESLDFFMTKLSDEGVHINFDEFDRNIRIKTQPLLLSQVILNLIQNARDAIYTQQEPWIRLSAARVGTHVEIRVTDSGSGIPEELQERIFNPFYTTKAMGKGTGLGLSLSKSIIESLQGRLTLDKESPNTCFVIRL